MFEYRSSFAQRLQPAWRCASGLIIALWLLAREYVSGRRFGA
jgi:hypothetical protein